MGFITGVRKLFLVRKPRMGSVGVQGSGFKICREMVQKGAKWCKNREHDREFTQMGLRGLPFLYLFFTTMVFVGGVDRS